MERFEQAAERYRVIAENTPDLICETDNRGVFTYLSPNYHSILGYHTDELLGTHFAGIVHPDDIERVTQEFFVAEDDLCATHDLIFRVRHRGGDWRWLEVSGNPVQTANGEHRAIFVSREITNRKKVEESLRRIQQLHEVTLENLGEAVLVTDAESRVHLWNSMAESLLGLDPDNLRDQPINKVLRFAPQQGRKFCPVQEALKSRKPVRFPYETALCTKRGAVIDVAGAVAPITDPQGAISGVVLAFSDVTLQRRSEREMLKTSKLESISVLAGGVAHDFNNILTAIMGHLALAKLDAAAGKNSLNRVARAENACQRARGLTKQLLTFATGGQPIRRTVDLNEVVREAVDFSLPGSMVQTQLDLFEGSLWVDLDEDQFTQVLSNLMINASHAMPDGGRLEIQTTRSRLADAAGLQLEPGDYTVLRVSDQGVGIDPEHMERIFDPFFTTKSGGHGLGLAACFSIVRSHGGAITVESKVGEGTTFKVFLPSAAAAPSHSTAYSVGSSTDLRSARVLIMDDEEEIRALCHMILSSRGIHTELASSGEEAVKAYIDSIERDQKFDLVLMDLTIPGGMGGCEAIQRLKQIDPEVCAIVSSGYSNDSVMSHFSDHGFSGVVSKPYRPEDLLREIERLLQPRQVKVEVDGDSV